MAHRATEVRTSDGRLLCRRCLVADSAVARARGLLGRRALPPEEGLLLRPAGSIHTFFMRFAIDAVFLDREGVVLRVAHRIRPWRVRAQRRARAVLELPSGTCERVGIAAGDRLALAKN